MEDIKNLFVYFRGKPGGVFEKETDYHKQKQLEKKNPIFKRGGYR